MTFELPVLAYGYDALEPYIDASTMEIHYSRHHKTYMEKFNAALEKYPNLYKKKAESIIADFGSVPEEIRASVRNMGGGYVNHNFFWEILGIGHECKGEILEKIRKQFGSFEVFKEKFSDSALKLFGSGWTWLVVDKKGDLEIINLPNQDSPLSIGKRPILTLDLWEHAYYLKHQNKRADYIGAFWNVVNWKRVEEIYKN